MNYNIKINDQTIPFDRPIRVLDLIDGDRRRYICCSVNNRIRELNYPLHFDAEVKLLTKSDYHAIKAYETSLRFITVMACSRAFPNQPVKLSYNMSRSIFLTFAEPASAGGQRIPEPSFDSRKLAVLKQTIDSIISADYPIVRKVMTKDEAVEFYREHGYDDKIALLKYRPEKIVHLNECDGYMNYMYGHMVPSTGCISDYRLTLFGNGIMIQYPRSEEKGGIPPFEEAAVYGRTLRDSYLRSKLMGTDSIAGINRRVEKDGPVDFINMCESVHNDMLAELGRKIQAEKDSIRLICIAGPSSSGKTTFANRLRVELMSRGLEPLRISLDDYYLDHSQVPLDEEGKPDFECVESLNLEQINSDLIDLINGEEVSLPVFDFIQKKRVPGRKVKLCSDQPIIIEGIHALNDRVSSMVPKAQKFRIYIAPQAQISFDNHTPISLTDLRLLRRIVRDNQFRGTSAEQTIAMWPSVRRGEFRWIYATQENADFVFNSLLPYEMCVMKKYAMPLLRKIDPDSPAYPLANRLEKFLKNFLDLEDTVVPCDSIMREFIGGSCFADV